MNKLGQSLLLSLLLLSAFAHGANSLYDLEVKDIEGKLVSMKKYKGQVLLIVNTASQCGFTPQLKELTELQTKYGPQGFQVLAFPSNDFKQDKGSNEEIKSFSEQNYSINFPLFDKAPVSGDSKQPIYQLLEAKSIGFPNRVLWNFEKFLIARDGRVVDRYRSLTSPSSKTLTSQIEKLLIEPQ